ncbi:MAG: SAM-dependent methyltransferase [Alphaproteobacteria bacterium 16-39-46]|nr:MAG: SAM-dependent methyltransferase [Alphaproteobacteria bacterium 16-39-46]OZA44504.1 MAG: SAM-dependent methyltransferase [Alphaproteobacteria bacterium 17-39-52]HQS83351.1 class I SAM-dependent methyltransferase [Alphaproteobacteria bacterium]HQS93038.1 class I SAM-dependent methyltransferase [Alphaproteobacteria bacterium]
MVDTSKKSIQEWWAKNPMTYGEVHGQTDFKDHHYEMGTLEFFDRLDQEFYSWNRPLHDQKPFDRLFPYNFYQGKKILEIGCGLGSMLMNWARNGADCTGVDLNPTSIEQSKKRFEILGLNADIRLEDANHLPFPDNTFDYVYSWGVLHHSPNLDVSIKELFRVLKPGGGFGIMLYNRKSLYQWYMTDYVEGFLHQEAKFLSPLELNSRYGDGHREEGNPHTWPVTREEGLELLHPFSKDATVRILGTDLECVLRLMLPGISHIMPKAIVKALARRWGWSLWFHGTKET